MLIDVKNVSDAIANVHCKWKRTIKPSSLPLMSDYMSIRRYLGVCTIWTYTSRMHKHDVNAVAMRLNIHAAALKLITPKLQMT